MALCPYRHMQCPETSVGNMGCFLWGTGCPKKAGGVIYSKTMTMSDDNSTRFETSAKSLKDVVILVETNPVLLGATGVEVVTVVAGGSIGFTNVEISTLYFKNASAGNNGKISILGVEN